jgi:hypothetical protein
MKWAVTFLATLAACSAQEAGSGFDVRATLSTAAIYSHEFSQSPRSGQPLVGAFQTILYPTWKLSSHWAFSGAVQAHSRPYFNEQFRTQGYGFRADVLQANLSYTRIWSKGSLVARAGMLSSAFGSFLLRYDAAVNPLASMPLTYGYYGKGVTNLGLMGAQVDATLGRLDVRAQFANSSPANRRSIFDRDQYGNWAGGAGFTIRQGFRVGVSAFRGPYLHRQFQFYFPGEAKPKDLPGSGYGIDVQWARGHWNLQAELQRFQNTYVAIPTFNQHGGYVEARRVLNPRWFAATRIGYLRASAFPGRESYELGGGFRMNRFQLLKFGYQIQHGPAIRGTLENAAVVQWVTSFHPISLGRD